MAAASRPPTRKRRRDHTVTDPQWLRTLTSYAGRRIMPEIRKAFAYEAKRFEGFKIGCTVWIGSQSRSKSGELSGRKWYSSTTSCPMCLARTPPSSLSDHAPQERRRQLVSMHAASSDSIAPRRPFVADPHAALAWLAEPVLLDEWQVAPEILGAVKRAVDEDSRPQHFGSTWRRS